MVHGLPSSHLLGPLGVHTPALQVSPTVQLLLSSQTAVLLLCLHPLTLWQLSSVHGLPSSQLTDAPDTQLPLAQASPTVHTSSSEHGIVFATLLQPAEASHASVVHRLLSSQFFAAPGAHLPPLQTSLTVHTLLSVQVSVLFTAWQPFSLSQLSFVHGLLSSQFTTLPGTHAPSLQVSPTVQTEPSSHAAVLLLCVQPFWLSQASVVHGLSSLQSSAAPGMHAVSLHESAVLHALLSVQVAVLAKYTQPLALSQVLSVQTLPSSHTTSVPDWHFSFAQTSPCVHTLLSLHGWLLAWWVQPFLASQASSVHMLLSSQPIAAPGTHWLSWQMSPSVQVLLSVHGALLAVWVQPLPALQASSVHKLASLQSIFLPPMHDLPAQLSALVHASPSSHGTVLGMCAQPLTASHESSVHKLLSSHATAAPGWQLPPWHTSLSVQALLSVHALLLLAKTQPPFWSQSSLVHRLPSSHFRPAPETHLPPAHTSPLVQALPSSHATLLGVWVQPPALGLHASLVHSSLSSQSKGLPGMHAPPLQVSTSEQALPSSHAPVLLTWTHALCALQLSVVHGLPSLQFRGWAVTHRPLWHWSPKVQASLSVHGLLFATLLQPSLGSHESVVQPLASSHVVAAPGRQAPTLQASPPVQALLSEHAEVLFVNTQPFSLSQLSSVHGLPSLQTIAVPGTQAPAAHVSPVVHTSPSLQGAALSVLLQPPAVSQISVVQGLPSSQGLAFCGLQTPAVQVSPCVHWL